MTVSSGFFNSVNHDRLYDAEQLSSIFDGIIIDGVYENYGDAFHVMEYTESDNTIIIGTGRAWFDHTWTLNDSQFSMTIDPPNEMLGRTDAIVIDVDHRQSERTNSIVYVKGSESSPDDPPVLINEDLHKQHPIAYIKRNAGSNQVVHQKDITDLVGTESCPVVTGILEAQNLANLWAQLEDEFNTWWDGIKDTLDENTVTNLQNQINELKERDQARGDGVGLLTKEVYDLFKTGSYPVSVKTFNVSLSDMAQQPHYGGVYILPDGKIIVFRLVQRTQSSHIQGYTFYVDIYNTDGVKTTTKGPDMVDYTVFGGMGFDIIKAYVDAYPCSFVLGSMNTRWETSSSASDFKFMISIVTISVQSDGTVNISDATNKTTTSWHAQEPEFFATERPLSDGSFIYGAVSGCATNLADTLRRNLTGFAIKVSQDGIVGNFVTSDTYCTYSYPQNYNNYAMRIAVFEDSNVGRFSDKNGNVYYNEIDLEDLTSVEKQGTISYPVSNYNLANFPSTVVVDEYKLSEENGFTSSHKDVGDTSAEVIKISDYYTGATNSGDDMPEGTYYCTPYGDSSYVGVMSNGKLVAIGSNGGAAILKAKKSSVSISSNPIAVWLNGFKVIDDKTIIVRLKVSQSYSNKPQMVNPDLESTSANITVIGG